jgi:hypothetical protein
MAWVGIHFLSCRCTVCFDHEGLVILIGLDIFKIKEFNFASVQMKLKVWMQLSVEGSLTGLECKWTKSKNTVA